MYFIIAKMIFKITFLYIFAELELRTECVVKMEGQQTILENISAMDKKDR